MIINILNSCLFEEFRNGKFGVLAHSCNAKKKFNSGVAKGVRLNYPEAYKVYLTEQRLGEVSFCKVGEDKHIGNIIAQENYGYDKKQYVNYEALRKGFDKVFKFAKDKDLVVGLPNLIGCGLGGGDWSVVLPMIEVLSEKHHVDAIIVSQPKVSKF